MLQTLTRRNDLDRTPPTRERQPGNWRRLTTMLPATAPQQAELFPPHIENAAARGRIVVVCEHASNTIPQRWGDMGLSSEQRLAHIAWDPGAVGLARGLAQRLDAVLVHAPVSRLV